MSGLTRKAGGGCSPRPHTTLSAAESSATGSQLLAILAELKEDGKRIVGYGASARGNTLLNYYRHRHGHSRLHSRPEPARGGGLLAGDAHPRSRARSGSPRTIPTTCS